MVHHSKFTTICRNLEVKLRFCYPFICHFLDEVLHCLSSIYNIDLGYSLVMLSMLSMSLPLVVLLMLWAKSSVLDIPLLLPTVYLSMSFLRAVEAGDAFQEQTIMFSFWCLALLIVGLSRRGRLGSHALHYRG